MDEIIVGVLVIGTLGGSILLGVFLCLLPPRLFLRDAPWLTEEEFLATVPEKAWCRHTPTIAILVGFPTYLLLFLGVQFTCNNTLPFLVAMVPLYFMWIYVVVGVVEVTSGVSVLVPVGTLPDRAPFARACSVWSAQPWCWRRCSSRRTGRGLESGQQ
jgi:hypothetical protein